MAPAKVTTEKASRFKDAGERIESFEDNILANCPRCGQCANLTSTPGSRTYACVCDSCGYSEKHAIIREPYRTDWYARRDSWNKWLRLQTPCCGDTLYALNGDHLTFLESYISAKLRGRRHDPKLGWSNKSLSSRMPQWMTSAKNRDEVLKCIRRLKSLLPPPETSTNI